MKVMVLGTGYVGLVSGTCLAEIGHQITCVDVDASKVERLQAGEIPIYEPGLDTLVASNTQSGRLRFQLGAGDARAYSCVFLAVGTPSSEDGSANLQYLFQAARDVIPTMGREQLLITKSTVPVGTAAKLKELCRELGRSDISVVSNPEFLREGHAVKDFMQGDRIVVGTDNQKATDTMAQLYAPLVEKGMQFISMENAAAEMVKYAANCFLAMKISFINELASLCEKVGCDIEDVRAGMTTDHRIGNHFLNPGPGYGGSCFPKDVQALIKVGEEYSMRLQMIESTHEVNQRKRKETVELIRKYCGDLKGLKVGIWGVTFKAHTDDIREASASSVVQELESSGAQIQFYDPQGAEHFERDYGSDFVRRAPNKEKAIEGMDVLVVLTEWPEFVEADLSKVASMIQKPFVFDPRNLYGAGQAKQAGLNLVGNGRYFPC